MGSSALQLFGEICHHTGNANLLRADCFAAAAGDAVLRTAESGNGISCVVRNGIAAETVFVIEFQQCRDLKTLGAALYAIAAGGAGSFQTLFHLRTDGQKGVSFFGVKGLFLCPDASVLP